MSDLEDLKQVARQFERDLESKKTLFLRLAIISGIMIVVLGATKGFAEETKEESFTRFLQDNVYVGIGAGKARGDIVGEKEENKFDNKGVRVLVGLQLNDYLALEAEQFTNLTKHEVYASQVGYRYGGIFLKAETPVSDAVPISAFIRGGRLWTDASVSWKEKETRALLGPKTTLNDSNWGMGVGFSYHLGNGVSLRAERTWTDHTNIDMTYSALSTVIRF